VSVRLVTTRTTPARQTELWSRQTQVDGRWGELQLVDRDDADYTVVIDSPGGRDGEPPEIDPATTILLQMEPKPAGATPGPALDPRPFAQVRALDRYPRPIEWHLGWDLADALTEPVPRVFIRLPLESPDEARRIVLSAIADDEWSRRIEAIRAEKRRIVSEAQIIPTLARTIRGHQLAASLDVEVMNVDRDTDRWTAFEARLTSRAGEGWVDRSTRRSAVDPQQLPPADELASLFRGNEVDLDPDVVATALTHRDAWRRVVESGRPTLVLTDAAELIPDFAGQLVELCGWLDAAPAYDLVFLGRSSWDEELEWSRRPLWLPTRPEPFEPDNFIRGTFGYLVSPAGAARLLALAERDGVEQGGIDWFISSHSHELDVRSARPPLVVVARNEPGSPADPGSDSTVEPDLSSLT
jgi:hypothetical protein